MSNFNWMELLSCIITAVASYFLGHKVGSKKD